MLRVVNVSPSFRVETTAAPKATSARSQITPPWTVPMAL
jgi:hypothetical protein